MLFRNRMASRTSKAMTVAEACVQTLYGIHTVYIHVGTTCSTTKKLWSGAPSGPS